MFSPPLSLAKVGLGAQKGLSGAWLQESTWSGGGGSTGTPSPAFLGCLSWGQCGSPSPYGLEVKPLSAPPSGR